jgi:hypothetical protein
VPGAHPEDPLAFDSLAGQLSQQASQAVQAAAARAALPLQVAGAHSFPGCVHLLLEVLHHAQQDQGEAQQAGDWEAQQLQAFQQSLGTELQLLLHQDILLSVQAPAAADDEEQQQGPGVVPLPACVPCSGGAAVAGQQGSTPVSLVLEQGGQLQAALAGRRSVRALATAASAAPSGPGSSSLVLLDCSCPVAVDEGGAAALLDISLPACSDPAVIQLHLLPSAANAACSGAGEPSSDPHPLASLPLLAFPQPAAAEVQGLFGRMVAAIREEEPALEEGAAAQRAYWQHFAPFVQSWRLVVLVVNGAGGIAGAEPAGDGAGAAAGAPAVTLAGSGGAAPAAAMLEVVEACGLASFLEAQGMPACLQLLAALLQGSALLEAMLAAMLAGTGQQGRAQQAVDEQDECCGEDGSGPAAPGPAADERSWCSCSSSDDNSTAATADLLRGLLSDSCSTPGTPSTASCFGSPGSTTTRSPCQAASGGGGGACSASSSCCSKPSCSKASTVGLVGPSPSRRNTAVQRCRPLPLHAAGRRAALTWRALLLGFPDAATEASYLAFANARRALLVDPYSALLHTATVLIVNGRMLASGLARPPLSPGVAASFLEGAALLAAWLLLLCRGRWYTRHREAVMLALPGGGRVASALVHGVLSLASGRDHGACIPNCALILPVACALHYPATLQVRALPGALLTAVDALGAGCYAAFKSGSGLVGALVGLLAGAAGLGVTLLAESRCRAAFLAAGWRGRLGPRIQ